MLARPRDEGEHRLEQGFPIGVRLYSTLGGTSANASRRTRPSVVSERSVTVSMRCEIPGMAFCNSVNRSVPRARVDTTNIDHLSPTRVSNSRTKAWPSGVRSQTSRKVSVVVCVAVTDQS
jgi:hypothetical protein